MKVYCNNLLQIRRHGAHGFVTFPLDVGETYWQHNARTPSSSIGNVAYAVLHRVRSIARSTLNFWRGTSHDSAIEKTRHGGFSLGLLFALSAQRSS